MNKVDWKGTDVRPQDFHTPRSGKEAFGLWSGADLDDGKAHSTAGFKLEVLSWVVLVLIAVVSLVFSRGMV